MTNPFARPEQPDETIPLVPDSGYADQTSAWSSSYESTSIDPLADEPVASGGYTNPVVPPSGGYGYGDYANPYASAPAASTNPPAAPTPYPRSGPGSASPYPPPEAVAPAAYPQPQPSVAPAASPLSLPPYAPAPVYEQPPLAYGTGPFEPARDTSGAQVTPAYSYVYAPQQIEHPNAVTTLVLGLLGFIFGITWPIAWYLGAKGNAEIKREPQRYRPSGMMTVGMVLGAIGTILMALGIIGIVLLVALVIAMGA